MFKDKNDYYLFHPALKTGMELPPPKREHEVGLYKRPNYCLYHPFLVHTLEGCAAFKIQEWIAETLGVGMQIDSK